MYVVIDRTLVEIRMLKCSESNEEHVSESGENVIVVIKWQNT